MSHINTEQLIEIYRKRWTKEVTSDWESEFVDLIDQALHQQLKTIKEKIHGMGFKDPNEAGQFAMHADGYNEAIDDIINSLSSPKEKSK